MENSEIIVLFRILGKKENMHGTMSKKNIIEIILILKIFQSHFGVLPIDSTSEIHIYYIVSVCAMNNIIISLLILVV